MAKYLTREQTNNIQGRLKMRGENTVTLAAKLGIPWSTVAGTINGYRANPKARRAIADFLGERLEALFGKDHRQDACATKDAGATGAEVRHG